jgi:hypothetical protein
MHRDNLTPTERCLNWVSTQLEQDDEEDPDDDEDIGESDDGDNEHENGGGDVDSSSSRAATSKNTSSHRGRRQNNLWRVKYYKGILSSLLLQNKSELKPNQNLPSAPKTLCQSTKPKPKHNNIKTKIKT